MFHNIAHQSERLQQYVLITKAVMPQLDDTNTKTQINPISSQ